jgi:hypothetical protein
MPDHEGVRRRDVLKSIGMTGAAVGIATTAAPSALTEAQAQAAPHAPLIHRSETAKAPIVFAISHRRKPR